jgi:hypothetical protein
MVEIKSYSGHYTENEVTQEAHRMAKEVMQESRTLSSESNLRTNDVLEIFISNLLKRAGVPPITEVQGEFD